MNRRTPLALAAGLCAFALAGCSTVREAIAYGKGPFDQSPAATSAAALDGLHESSWGNSGKWGGAEPQEPEETEPDSPPPDTPPASPPSPPPRTDGTGG